MESLNRDYSDDWTARILVVDDEETVCEALAHLLRQMRYTADTATSGEEAIEMIREIHYDLILLDLVLPEMSGQDTFDLIRRIDTGIPIIIITGYGSIESAVEFLKNGAVDYFAKPIHPEEFKFRINRALEEKKLRQQAITDLKTQLFNHSYFETRLEEELRRSERYGHSISLLMLDLDNFKNYNDSHGHLAGDQVLRQVGTVLKRVMRNSDIPCRFGGEEFSVILPETDPPGAQRVAETIRANIQNLSFDSLLPGEKNRVTISVGVASCSAHSDSNGGYGMNLIIESADRALFEAKRTGKNRVCVADGLCVGMNQG
jgi:diguanylate cyclase (GGDEF)-like protein